MSLWCWLSFEKRKTRNQHNSWPNFTNIETQLSNGSQNLTGFVGYTLERCRFSCSTDHSNAQSILKSSTFWLGVFTTKVTGESKTKFAIALLCPLFSMSDELAFFTTISSRDVVAVTGWPSVPVIQHGYCLLRNTFCLWHHRTTHCTWSSLRARFRIGAS